MKKPLKIVCIFFTLLVQSRSNAQSSAMNYLVDSYYSVITGRLLSIEQSHVRLSESSITCYYFVKVEESFKGNFQKGDTAVIQITRSICGDRDTAGVALVGKSYVIFLRKPSGSFMGRETYRLTDKWFGCYEASGCFCEEVRNKCRYKKPGK